MNTSSPNAALIFLAQITALEASLKHSMTTLDALQRSDPLLHRAAQSCFQQLVDSRARELTELRCRIANHAPDAALWRNLETTKKGCEDVFADCLAVIGSALVRRDGLDDGTCRIADSLLAELGGPEIGWPRFTVLAPSTTFTRRTDLISVRFPEFGIWSLPVIAHELGHYVVKREGGSRFPYLFGNILDDERKLAEDALAMLGDSGAQEQPQAKLQHDRQRLEELFCDLFAIYTLGPAYACSMIVLECAPQLADIEPGAHPSDGFRVAWMLHALENLDKGHECSPVIDQLGAFWNACIRSAGVTATQPAPENSARSDPRVDRWLKPMLRTIRDNFGVARFTGWAAALAVANELLAGGCAEEIRARFKSRCNAPLTIASVLNGAWWWRISKGDLRDTRDPPSEGGSVEAVGASALSVCRALS